MIIEGVDSFTRPSFSLRNRLARSVWFVFWIVFLRFSPRPFHVWRAFWLRVFGARIGKDVHVYPSVTIWAPWNLSIGDRVGIGPGANIYNMAFVKIGSDVVVSQGAHVCGGTHDVDDAKFQLIAKPIEIGDRAWICAEAFLGPGVYIASGVVVGARAVVFKSINEVNVIWVGNPARFIRKRKRVI